MNKSIWEDYQNNLNYPKLKENIEADVLVIGGGITGILIAKKLTDNNIKTVLLEKDKIGSGNTSKTTAFLTVQHETLYQDLGLNKAKEYLNINNEALKEYKELSNYYDFDFEVVDSCLFSSNRSIIEKEYAILSNLNQDVYINENIPFEDKVTGISFRNQAIINPIKLLNELSIGLTIYENTEVIKLKKNYAITKDNKIIKFNKAIITTHYPINNKLNLLFLKLTQRRSYVVVIKKDKIKGTYCSINENGLYYRMYKDYLIIGGNDRDTGTNCNNDFNELIINKFNLKKDDILYSWSGQDCITLDGIPYIGTSSMYHNNHIIVTGFNLWGFTWAMASANMVLKMIKDNTYTPLTKLRRNAINKNLFKNIKTSLVNLINIKKPRCTHLGCALKYNERENIYECPCHGSRYNNDKVVIDGPAKKAIK